MSLGVQSMEPNVMAYCGSTRWISGTGKFDSLTHSWHWQHNERKTRSTTHA